MNAFTFGDQAFLARAGADYNPMLPLNYSGLWRWYRADSYPVINDGDTIGGGISAREPWRDESGQFIDPGVTTAVQALTVVDISGGSFVFTAAHVGQTIRYNSGGAAKNSLITTRNSNTQVIVDTSQAVAATTFRICDDARLTTGGPQYKANIVGTKPVIRFVLEYMNIAPGSFNDFTVIAVQRRTANNSFIFGDSFVANHQIRRDWAGDNTTTFYSGGASTSASALGAPANLMAMTVRRTGAATTFRENKTSRGGGNEAGAWSPLELGSASVGGHIDMAEILVYKGTVLSDANVDFLYDNYLKKRWTTLP